ncbi:MAG: ORF6N domain-containing protein [Bacteroidales bacterium]|nr:ORF6N domain-containing protein [Bacteroidales bacterium]
MELQLTTIENKIYEIRGRRVMLDVDLAEMYGIETAQLKRAVRRNMERFEGEDFMFQLTREEISRCQFGILNKGRGGNIKYLPFAFGELGVAMLSSVLNTVFAIEVNRRIMRAFVAVREYLLTRASESVEIAQLRERMLQLERGHERLKRADEDNLEAMNDLSEDVRKDIDNLYNAIGALSTKMPQLDKNRIMIGFKRRNEQQ